MATALFVLGVAAAAADVIVTILQITSGAGFLYSLIAGILGLAGGFSLIALGMLKEQADRLETKLDNLTARTVQAEPAMTCERCGKEYAGDYSSCPYCGQKR